MSDGRRSTREDAELAARLFDDVHRYGRAVEALLGNTRQIEQAQRYAGPRFPLYLLGEAEEDEDGNPVHDPERWDAERLRHEASPDGQNVQRLAKWRQEARELLGEKRPAALAAARHFGHELHPFLFPLEHKPEDKAAGTAMLKAAADLVQDLRAAALLLPYLEPRAEAGDHGPGAEGSAAAGRAGGERAAAAGDDGQAAPEADEEPERPYLKAAEADTLRARGGRRPECWQRWSGFGRRCRRTSEGRARTGNSVQRLEAVGLAEPPAAPRAVHRMTMAGGQRLREVGPREERLLSGQKAETVRTVGSDGGHKPPRLATLFPLTKAARM